MFRKIISALCTIMIIVSFAIPTFASTSPIINRLAGIDRYATAAAIAHSGWKQSDYVVLAYGENYPDALSAAPLASKYNAPILLTTSNNLPTITKQTLINLHAKNVIIIGGTAVISSTVESEISEMNISVTRIAGSDLYETAVLVAKQINRSSPMIFVVSGDSYADALSIAPIAASQQIPILLVPRNTLPDCVKNYIDELRRISMGFSAYIIGDSDIIDDSVYYQFDGRLRIAGADKYDRNIAINKEFIRYFKSDDFCLATGENFADALTGSVYAAKMKQPIILVNNTPQDNTKKYYQLLSEKSNTINVFGGTAVVADSLIQELGSTSILTDQTICKFKDKNLENVIRRTIYKSTGDITIKDLQSLKCLYANNAQIKDLSGIENCINLTALYLDNNQINDISALKRFENLTTLHLENNSSYSYSKNNVVNVNIPDDLRYIFYLNKNLIDITGGDGDIFLLSIPRRQGQERILIDNFNISVNKNNNYTLPSTVKAKLYQGMPRDSVPVKWNTPTVNTNEVGTFYYYGMVDGYVGYVVCILEVLG